MNEDRQDFYANSVNLITSIYDVTIQFRTQSPVSIELGKEPIIEAVGLLNIRMSPQHAKALAALLVKHISDYENQYGFELPIEEKLSEFWETRKA